MAISIQPYGWLLLVGVVVSFLFGWRQARRDRRLVMVYVGGLAGAFLGAKVVYVVAEGWLHFGKPDVWLQLATGKSILGALLGGYAGVEFAKRLVGYHAVTGDWFAEIVPVGIIVGRVGCLVHGCCLGVACDPYWFALRDGTGRTRWPAVPVEIAFNVVMLGVCLALRRAGLLRGQRFHLYLIAYGLFRFGHEFVRDEPRLVGPITGYHVAALAVAGFGALAFWRRRTEAASLTAGTAPSRAS